MFLFTLLTSRLFGCETRAARRCLCFGLLSAVAVLPTAFTRAAEHEGWQKAAEKLQRATVTVRVSNPEGDKDELESNSDAGPKISVCSGVFVAEKLVMTSVRAGSDSTIRVTLSGGGQATGKLRVIDQFSQMVLLEVDREAPAILKPQETVPAVGSSVMTASAWGAEKAIVSLGIVGGVERTLPNVMTPPLMQCDLRTTDTSSGAAVIDQEGALVGLLIAADHPETRRGWAYAVPAGHVSRLLRARSERGEQEGIVILTRRRPIVGLVLDGDERGIFIRRITTGSPAEKAGLQIGDRVIATDGIQIRSVYQALLPTLHKQPGDTLRFLVEREGKEQTREVTLGGGVEVPSAPLKMLGDIIRPQVDVQQIGKGTYATRTPASAVRELAVGDDVEKTAISPGMTTAQKMALLEKALERYRSAIELQQQDITKREMERKQQEELIKSLREELEQLKRQQGKK